ncbi:hypothetical protein MmiHf6_17690 [Methanimicrococcus hongohii]|uniref:Uncharacterized protein n=1 Tax=Methanimicrococcus hongohii TaxID=3028295 RepID=A0AA96V1Y2_9EURY|nr:hypothetical protein [Methanimicrococcus sp. Hf6]WNY24433.1 hypothetical protein MmiHf6_17690 [Methanimicrococcus sp. Hf6]
MTRRTFSLSKKSGNQKTTVTFQRNKAKTNCVLNPLKIRISEEGGSFEMLQFSSKSKLELFKPLPMTVYYNSNLFTIENPLFEVSSTHKSFKGVLEDMELQISALWDDFVLAENQLTPDGLLLQKNLLAYVRERNAQ